VIYDVLDYVGSYDDVRAVLGLPRDELADSTLALTIYKNQLDLALGAIKGVYAPAPAPVITDERPILDIFDDIGDDDPMYGAVQMYAVHVMADSIATTLPMIGVKTKSDGKSTVTRFSAESTWLATQSKIRVALSTYRQRIYDLFDKATTTPTTTAVIDNPYISVVKPLRDPVTGA
jgi:hypothetical protein